MTGSREGVLVGVSRSLQVPGAELLSKHLLDIRVVESVSLLDRLRPEGQHLLSKGRSQLVLVFMIQTPELMAKSIQLVDQVGIEVFYTFGHAEP